MKNRPELLVALSAMLCLPALAQAQTLTIKGVKTTGSGCHEGTTNAIKADTDGDGFVDFFQVGYGRFVAERPGKSVKSCMITLDVEVARNHQFSVFLVESRGYADLSEAHQVDLSTTYSYAAAPEHRLSSLISGPYTDEFGEVEQVSGPTWAPCGKGFPVHVKYRIAIEKKPGTGSDTGAYSLVQVDRTSGLFTQTFYLHWQRCS